MYEKVKADLEASRPDRFAGHNSARMPPTKMKAGFPAYNVPSVKLPRIDALNEKGKDIEVDLGNRLKGMTSDLTHFAQGARGVVKDLQAQKTSLTEGANREIRDLADRKDRVEHMFGDKISGLAASIGQRAHAAEELVRDHVSDAAARETQAEGDAVREARERLERLEEAARAKASSSVAINVSMVDRSTGSKEKKVGEDY